MLVHFLNVGTEVYTDDTALTWALADSLISCKTYSAKHMASR